MAATREKRAQSYEQNVNDFEIRAKVRILYTEQNSLMGTCDNETVRYQLDIMKSRLETYDGSVISNRDTTSDDGESVVNFSRKISRDSGYDSGDELDGLLVTAPTCHVVDAADCYPDVDDQYMRQNDVPWRGIRVFGRHHVRNCFFRTHNDCL